MSDKPPDEPPGQPAPRAESSAAEPYLCARCERPILTEKVVRIEAEGKGGPGERLKADGKHDRSTGYMLISHHCPCSALVLTTRRYGSYSGFLALFGRGVTLPYESPFRPTKVEDDHPLLMRWRWELAQTADIAEFVLWLDAERH